MRFRPVRRHARVRAATDVAALIYELLDAHDDTARLASSLAGDPAWCAHLDYLRRLQRVGRSTLARLPGEAAR
jgi:hypothetical protein